MTIYTLYIKTHKITGLKYLGQTKQNPFIYPGSGVDWTEHLLQYGDFVDTKILFQSTNIEERNYWGRYYSKYFNVVGAMDDYGNKIWANRIPETGGGPGWKKGELNPSKTPKFRKWRSESQRGSSNPKFDGTIYTFQHKITREIMHLTQHDFIKMSGAFHSNVSDLVNLNGRQKSVKKWTIIR
jgi:hypothetical protein